MCFEYGFVFKIINVKIQELIHDFLPSVSL